MSRGRPREFDRTEALNQAMKIFWQKGYTATSMNDLYEAMGIKSPACMQRSAAKKSYTKRYCSITSSPLHRLSGDI